LSCPFYSTEIGLVALDFCIIMAPFAIGLGGRINIGASTKECQRGTFKDKYARIHSFHTYKLHISLEKAIELFFNFGG
jgi:hypothetical protein